MKAGDKVTVNFTVVDAHDKDNVLLEASDGRRISLNEKVLVAVGVAGGVAGGEPEAQQA